MKFIKNISPILIFVVLIVANVQFSKDSFIRKTFFTPPDTALHIRMKYVGDCYWGLSYKKGKDSTELYEYLPTSITYQSFLDSEENVRAVARQVDTYEKAIAWNDSTKNEYTKGLSAPDAMGPSQCNIPIHSIIQLK